MQKDTAQAPIQNSSRAPASVLLAQALFLLSAVLWTVFGVWSLVRAMNGVPARDGSSRP